MTHPNFSEATWIERLAAALEQVAAEARPSYSPLPPETLGVGPIDEHWSALHRGYRALAARAKHDPTAAIQFKESHLWVEEDPDEAMAILREHPLMNPGLKGSGKKEAVRFRIFNGGFHSDLKTFVSRLAKLSVKEGGREAAQRLHRYLTAGANGTIPAHEITVIHGLAVKTRVNLYAGAYLAPYGDARAEFDLPEEPEPLSKTSFPDAAVLVRSLEYGPGVMPPDEGAGLPDVQVTHRFTADYRVDLENWFVDSKLLVDLLSIATAVPLLSRTLYVRLARWIEEMDPNFGFGTRVSQGYLSDVWPQGRDLSKDDADAFLKLARGWHTYGDKPDTMKLAIRRLAASVSRPGGRFGQEDRILDVAIALEIMYELDNPEIIYKLKTRAGYFLGKNTEDRMEIFDRVKHFYDARSAIVHGPRKKGRQTSLEDAFADGFDLARETLLKLLYGGISPDWNLLVMSAGECRQVT